MGCLPSNFRVASSEVPSLLELRTGAEVSLIPAPFAPETEAEWQALSGLPAMVETLRSAARSEITICQIAPASARVENISATYAAAMAASDTAFRFLGTCFAVGGRRIAPPEVPNAISIDTEGLAVCKQTSKPRVFALTANEAMPVPTLAALNSGLLTDILLDE